jgi:molecular chaperone GrpE (heat shock protein)
LGTIKRIVHHELGDQVLSVADNLQRAVASAEDRIDRTPGDAGLLDGVRATQRQLLATLARFGVKRIEALGASSIQTSVSMPR